MATIRQKINKDSLGHECCKCKRVIDEATIKEVLRRRSEQNKINIKNAHKAQNQNKRKSSINMAHAVALRQRGYRFKDIGIELAKTIGRPKPFTVSAISYEFRKIEPHLKEFNYAPTA